MFVYRFTHLKENSPLAAENWYYMRDTSACCFVNGQIAMTVQDLNETQWLVVDHEYKDDEEFQGPIMRLYKEGLEIDGDIWPDCYWQPSLDIATRIFEQDTGDWYEYFVTTETNLRNTQMTVLHQGNGIEMIQKNVASYSICPACPWWDREEGEEIKFAVYKEKSGNKLSVKNCTNNVIKVNGELLSNHGPVRGNLMEWTKNGRKYTVEDASIVVEARFGNAFKMTFHAFTPPERILEGVTLQLQVREEMWASIRALNECDILVGV